MITHKLITTTALLTALAIGAPAVDAGQRERRRDPDRGQSRERAQDRRRNDDSRRDINRDRRDGHRDNRSFGGRPVLRTYIAPRIVRPRIVEIVPYRPYYYRPSFRNGYRYGSPGYAYPPPGYLTVIPGRAYGGVRIKDAPEDAEVFADGYYVGVVDDFDNPFQQLNLEAGPHRIEIRMPGYQSIVFDVRVVPGQTVTYHADYR